MVCRVAIGCANKTYLPSFLFRFWGVFFNHLTKKDIFIKCSKPFVLIAGSLCVHVMIIYGERCAIMHKDRRCSCEQSLVACLQNQYSGAHHISRSLPGHETWRVHDAVIDSECVIRVSTTRIDDDLDGQFRAEILEYGHAYL